MWKLAAYCLTYFILSKSTSMNSHMFRWSRAIQRIKGQKVWCGQRCLGNFISIQFNCLELFWNVLRAIMDFKHPLKKQYTSDMAADNQDTRSNIPTLQVLRLICLVNKVKIIDQCISPMPQGLISFLVLALLMLFFFSLLPWFGQSKFNLCLG